MTLPRLYYVSLTVGLKAICSLDLVRQPYRPRCLSPSFFPGGACRHCLDMSDTEEVVEVEEAEEEVQEEGKTVQDTLAMLIRLISQAMQLKTNHSRV
ncbi:hypothetical protein AALO_G00222460 [Alosa alosa]|uniref:Uncharacterized protein n=1 Tax=Alosa alosa TaxID=278164 RepID=A0AAV6FXI9_9TELE|nr:hypothetical protein AALO_G00222460 [Alosa alosa]